MCASVGILGSFSYAALISLGLSPFSTILLMTTIPVIEALTFWVLLRNPNSIPKQNSEPKYRQTLDNQENGILNSKAKLSLGDKIRCLPSLMKYLVPFLLIFLFQYFINQGLVSVRNEKNSNKIPNILIFSQSLNTFSHKNLDGIGLFQRYLVGSWGSISLATSNLCLLKKKIPYFTMLIYIHRIFSVRLSSWSFHFTIISQSG